ncbi:MAG: zinc ribbon domain-containing protein [Gemmatimonadota bacterium]
MPYYEYRCAANDRTLEVRHGMNETLSTWGELAERTGTALGDVPADTPVEKLLSTPVPVTAAANAPVSGGCGAGCACARPA